MERNAVITPGPPPRERAWNQPPYLPRRTPGPCKVLTVFGTRPEAIKLAPVLRAFGAYGDGFQTVNVSSAQHTDLLYPLVRALGIRIDYDLEVMEPGQTLNGVCARVLASLDGVLALEEPGMVLVQGDTTTALAGALAAFNRGVTVGHIEAGLRSGDTRNPFPEEMNRRLISRLATYHFAATEGNRDRLLAEGVNESHVFVTGNPVVDSLKEFLTTPSELPAAREVLGQTEGLKRLVLTTHRRESFGGAMTENLRVLRRFVRRREDVALIFPVHPNPAVVEAARKVFHRQERVHLVEPLPYAEFVRLLARAWLIVSDSGGVQEEAPTLGRPLLVLRETTERPEAVESGVARLVGGTPARLAAMLEEAYEPTSWAEAVRVVENPFGRGDSGRRIARLVAELFGVESASVARRRVG